MDDRAPIETRIHSLVVLAEHLAADFGNLNHTGPHVMLRVDVDTYLALPEDVQAWCARHEPGGIKPPVFTAPAGILAKWALGHEIPSAAEWAEEV